MLSPYQQNIDIIKGFFRKPIVLILTMGSFVSIALGIILSFFNLFGNLSEQAMNYVIQQLPRDIDTSQIIAGSGGGSNFNLDITGVMLAVTFLLFYVLSKKQENKLGVPSIMFKVISIVVVVVLGISTAFILFLLLLLACLSSTLDSMFSGMGTTFLYLYIFLSLYMVFYLIYAVSQLVFSISIRKSLTSIYLKKSGAMFYGIMSFINAAFAIAVSIISLLFLSNLGVFSLNEAQISVTAVTLAVSTINSIFTGIMAIQYARYINNVSQKFVTEYIPETPVQQDAEQTIPQSFSAQQIPQDNIPVQQAPVPPAPTVQEPILAPTMQDENPFEPAQTHVQAQPEPIQPPHAPIQPQIQPIIEQQAPVVQNKPLQNAPEEPAVQTARFCTQCGKPVGPDDYFCNNCGTKIIRNS